MDFRETVAGQMKEKAYQLISGQWNNEEVNHRDVKKFIGFGDESILEGVLQIP